MPHVCSFNRTFMELKLSYKGISMRKFESFNRTFMELKLEKELNQR